jgi:hypothetical protein
MKRRNRLATQALIDAELERIEALYEKALVELRKEPRYKDAPLGVQEQMDRDFDDEYDLLLSNLFWLLKKEYGIAIGVSLATTTGITCCLH